MKKAFLVFFILVFALSVSIAFTSCKPAAETTAAAKIKAAMLTDVGGLSGSEENKGFNDLGWDGFKKAEKELGVEILLVESREQADYEANIRKLAEQKFDVIVGVGFLLTDAINNMAQQYPDIKFAIIDSVVDQPNVASFVFTEEQGSFLVGMLAAYLTSTTGNDKINADKIVGFVGGMEGPLIEKFEAGYKAGVMTVDPDVQVLSAYTGSFVDAGKGKEIGISEFNNKADVIYHAAGESGLGVFEAAKENNFFAIGVDTDQKNAAPGFVVASMIKRVEVASFTAIKDAVEGTFKGGIHVLSTKEDGIGYTITPDLKDLFSQEIIDKVEAAKKMIIDGTITVPSTLADLEKFQAPEL
jgi:basic membrane protein A